MKYKIELTNSFLYEEEDKYRILKINIILDKKDYLKINNLYSFICKINYEINIYLRKFFNNNKYYYGKYSNVILNNQNEYDYLCYNYDDILIFSDKDYYKFKENKIINIKEIELNYCIVYRNKEIEEKDINKKILENIL